MTPILEDIVAESARLLEEAPRRGVVIRLLGGLAVRLQTETAVPASLVRSYQDIDLATTKPQRTQVSRFLTEMGYEQNERFNAWNETRLMFHDESHERHVDVFVGEFRMCHHIALTDRLEVDARTVPLAELLLTKLQIVRLNAKDLVDIYALLYAHDLGDVDDDTINVAQIASLCATDWGLWRTTTKTLEEAHRRLEASPLEASEQAPIAERIDRLRERIDAERKSMRWKARGRVGERARWYEEPEEIETDMRDTEA
jgi:hypothetical protein